MATFTHTGADIVFPTIPGGGAAADDLLDAIMAAKRHLQNALESMQRAAIVARGEHYSDRDDWEVARRQQIERCQTLRALIAEMDAHAANAMKQVKHA